MKQVVSVTRAECDQLTLHINTLRQRIGTILDGMKNIPIPSQSAHNRAVGAAEHLRSADEDMRAYLDLLEYAVRDVPR